MKNNLTIQSVVKNEPLIYYAIKSVYDFCESILLYDTGSNGYTLQDIEQLLSEDKDKKIIFKQIKLDFDEERWSLDNIESFVEKHRGLMSVGKVRQIQINDTKTKYFMLVDGDEVHYRQSMYNIVNKLEIPKNKYAVGLPLNWFYDLEHTFTDFTFPYNGRIFQTDKVFMNDDSPNEQHIIKGTNEVFHYEHPNYLIYYGIIPYAHFETVIRPWRRKHKVSLSNIKPFNKPLPEVMVENPIYLNRWKNGKN